MEGIEDELFSFNINDVRLGIPFFFSLFDLRLTTSQSTPDEIIMEGVQHTFALLNDAYQSHKLPTRVLDDAFHYMDRLLRLLSKKHSAFKAFAHDFSEAIFIRDKADELAVHAVLEKHGVSWEYAKRAKAAALNRRIRRYIPSHTVLLRRLETLYSLCRYSMFNKEESWLLFLRRGKRDG